MFKLDKNNYDNNFVSSIIWCSICEQSKTISFGPCNIMIAQQNIDVILSMCNTYKQFYIVTHPIHNCNLNFITRILLFETE